MKKSEDSKYHTKIFPNHTTNEFTIESLSTISNVEFLLVRKNNYRNYVSKKLFQINVNKYAEGIYFCENLDLKWQIENHSLMISR